MTLTQPSAEVRRTRSFLPRTGAVALSVATTVACGQPWWNVWVLFAAAHGGVWQDRGGALVVLAPVSAALTIRGRGPPAPRCRC